jgi:hypothetical protein
MSSGTAHTAVSVDRGDVELHLAQHVQRVDRDPYKACPSSLPIDLSLKKDNIRAHLSRCRERFAETVGRDRMPKRGTWYRC